MAPRLQERYDSEIRPALEQLGIKNPSGESTCDQSGHQHGSRLGCG